MAVKGLAGRLKPIQARPCDSLHFFMKGNALPPLSACRMGRGDQKRLARLVCPVCGFWITDEGVKGRVTDSGLLTYVSPCFLPVNIQPRRRPSMPRPCPCRRPCQPRAPSPLAPSPSGFPAPCRRPAMWAFAPMPHGAVFSIISVGFEGATVSSCFISQPLPSPHFQHPSYLQMLPDPQFHLSSRHSVFTPYFSQRSSMNS